MLGVNDPVWGEKIGAILVLSTEGASRGADAALGEIKKWMEREVAAYKVPRVWLLQSEIPKNAMGKVLTSEVFHFRLACFFARIEITPTTLQSFHRTLHLRSAQHPSHSTPLTFYKTLRFRSTHHSSHILHSSPLRILHNTLLTVYSNVLLRTTQCTLLEGQQKGSQVPVRLTRTTTRSKSVHTHRKQPSVYAWCVHFHVAPLSITCGCECTLSCLSQLASRARKGCLDVCVCSSFMLVNYINTLCARMTRKSKKKSRRTQHVGFGHCCWHVLMCSHRRIQ